MDAAYNDLSCCEISSSNGDIDENESRAQNESQDLTDCAVKIPFIEFTNERGNVRVKERKILRDEMLEKLNQVFATHPYERKQNVNGGFSLCLGIDRRTGKHIWAHIQLTVNDKAPNIDSYTGAAKKVIDVPQLF